MKKPQSLSEISIVFEKKFDSLDRKEILEENTYLYDSLSIEKIDIQLTLHGGKKVIIDFEDVLDWEIEMDEIYIDDEILE